VTPASLPAGHAAQNKPKPVQDNMIVSDEIRRLRRFVAVRIADDTFRLVGSGFFRPPKGRRQSSPYPLCNGAIHRGRLSASNPQILPLLPTESFLSNPSGDLIADDF
jgi:hypothetical protein